MDGMNNQPQEGNVNSDILFSKTIKAGKRVYYIDVKCDSRGEYYLLKFPTPNKEGGK